MGPSSNDQAGALPTSSPRDHFRVVIPDLTFSETVSGLVPEGAESRALLSKLALVDITALESKKRRLDDVVRSNPMVISQLIYQDICDTFIPFLL